MHEQAGKWLDFAAVITLQVMVLAVVLALNRPAQGVMRRLLPFSLVLGALVGAAFDLFVGESGAVFSYYLPLSLSFGLLNGLLSYGVALLTAAALPIEFGRIRLATFRMGLFLAVALGGAGVGCFLLKGAFANAVGLGLVILAAGEILLWSNQRLGPIFRLLSGKPRDFLLLWGSSAAIGAAYETANFFFPVWHWALFPERGRFPTFVSLVIGGYFVLFHALVVVAAFAQSPRALKGAK